MRSGNSNKLAASSNVRDREGATVIADLYVTLSYEEYKELERQCREFNETTHGEGINGYTP